MRKNKRKNKKSNVNKLHKRVNENNFLEATIDKNNKQLRVYTNDMLIKRYKRDSPSIGRSFDKVCSDEIKNISENFSKCICKNGDGFIRAADNNDEFVIECGKLILNATKTIQASVELLRAGYILQPGMLLRSVIEVFSLISYMHIEKDGFNIYKSGKLDINSTIKYGKRILPSIGQFQGLLSNEFVHISELHSDLNNISKYTEMIEPLKINLNLIRTAIWITYLISELVYFEYFEEHEFWNCKSENEYELKIDDNIFNWIRQEQL